MVNVVNVKQWIPQCELYWLRNICKVYSSSSTVLDTYMFLMSKQSKLKGLKVKRTVWKKKWSNCRNAFAWQSCVTLICSQLTWLAQWALNCRSSTNEANILRAEKFPFVLTDFKNLNLSLKCNDSVCPVLVNRGCSASFLSLAEVNHLPIGTKPTLEVDLIQNGTPAWGEVNLLGKINSYVANRGHIPTKCAV